MVCQLIENVEAEYADRLIDHSLGVLENLDGVYLVGAIENILNLLWVCVVPLRVEAKHLVVVFVQLEELLFLT